MSSLNDPQLKALKILLETTTNPKERSEIEYFIEQRLSFLNGKHVIPKSEFIEKIKTILLARRIENRELGVSPKDNIFDTKLLGLYGEEFGCQKYFGKRANSVNQENWDFKLKNGKTVQVKTRAIYSHNKDGIHIDFKNTNFDFVLLIVVSEKMEICAEGLIPVEILKKFLRPHRDKFRLPDVRKRYIEYLNCTHKIKAA